VDPLTAVLITAGVIVVAGAAGLAWRLTSGRARRARGERFAPGELPGLERFASGATLVQFSTEYCATCPSTRRFLGDVARARGGIAHHEVDLTHRPELAKRLRILQTPTVFVLDKAGNLARRFGGAPRRDELEAVLDALVPNPEWNL
jgi:thiol-disulfide isomerase/thioredoxin